MSSEIDIFKSFLEGRKRKPRPGEESSRRRGRFPASTRPNLGSFPCNPGEIVDESQNRLEEYYAEAARRLPLNDVDGLCDCVNDGGYCLGLADPVSNIIINAVGLLVHRQLAGHKKTPTTNFCYRPTGIEVSKMSRQSDAGQLIFMTGYFRHLNRFQARRYLRLASCDLAVAINLVRHERQPTCAALLPDGGRTQSALRSAAIRVQHPEPDVLARLMTAQYPSDLLSAVLAKLQGTREPLSVDDLGQVKDLLTRQWPQPNPSPVTMHFWCHPSNPLSGSYCKRSEEDGSLLISTGIGQDRVAEIRIRSTIKDLSDDKCHISDLNDDIMKAMVSKCLAEAPSGDEQHACANLVDERVLFLKLQLLDTIHAFYIKALAIMPIHENPELLRAFLVAGHCYGPMDPVSNIIINSCWYHSIFPLRNQVSDLGLPDHPQPGCFNEHPHRCRLPLPNCIIDTKSITRLAIRSLEGLVAVLRDGASMSLLQALEFLSTSHRDIFGALRLDPDNFLYAAKTAKHPQYVRLGSFLSNLYSDKVILDILKSQSDMYPRVVMHLHRITAPEISQHKDEAPPCKLTLAAAEQIITKKYFVREMQQFLSAKLDQVLHKYCYQHPWEPSFKLRAICGVNEPSHNGSLHHVNFFANSYNAEAVTGYTLFFAELWCESVPEKSSSCSPIPDDYIECIGRCSFCEKKGSKIIHPPSGGYFGDLDGSLDIDGSYGRLDFDENKLKSEGLLLTDYVYFDPARDHELAQALNSIHI